MDSKELIDNWNIICDHIKRYDDVDATQASAFLARLVPQAMSEGFLILTVDSEFIRDRVERYYRASIHRALQEIYGVPFIVNIEVDNSAPAPSVSSPAAPVIVPDKANSMIDYLINTGEAEKAAQDNYIDRSATVPTLEGLGSSLTFDNFVIGNSNRMAYSMAVAVAEMPGTKHLNPLFIHGKSGLGKTHLMRAIQNYIRETQPQLKTVYVDSAEFLAEFTDAAAAADREKESYKNFKNKYEEADVLLIDDVQFFTGKKGTLDIVFQIFNTLISKGKQVVLSADRAPKNIDIDERYKSRFNSGGNVDIQPPEIETKLGIVKNFIEEYRENENNANITIADNIQMYIAENSSSNIRELKSAVTKVIYQITYFNQPNITLEDVHVLLENHFSGGPSKRLTISDIQSVVEEYYKVTHADLIGRKRTKDIAYARQVAIYLCRQLLDLPFDNIGKKFNRDHSTIMYSFSLIDDALKNNRDCREDIDNLKTIIKEQ